MKPIDTKPSRRWAFAMCALVVASCGGGGGSSESAPAPVPTPVSVPTLTSIELAPLALSLSAGGSTQLTVTGRYSDGTTQVLNAAGETFISANAGVAEVSARGLVTVAGNSAAGSTATISAFDTASGVSTSAADSTVITVAAGTVAAPTSTSSAAASATAQSNAQCTAIQPFYWEIGNSSVSLASGSSTQTGGNAVFAATRFSIASASKWIYGMYVVQNRGGAAQLTATDIKFLNFTSGYTYMGSDTQSATCSAPASGADSINYCLTLPSATAQRLYSSQDATTVGVFDYDSGHEENHAGQFQPEINNLDTAALGTAIGAGLGVAGITLRYNQPLMAGGIYASASDYAPILRALLSGQLGMLEALGSSAVCAWPGSSCGAAYSPIVTEHWHYSIAHWVEDDPLNGDGAFSSPGAFGFYPWIESNKKYYGVISRAAPTGTGIQNGLASALCGRALRAAWELGVPQ